MQPVSLSQGQMRPSWFDLGQLPPHPSDFDEASIASSVIFVESLIVSQIQSGIDPSRIVLVGFSQGAALALMAALTTLNDLGGVASLSGWIPRRARDVSNLISPQRHIHLTVALYHRRSSLHSPIFPYSGRTAL